MLRYGRAALFAHVGAVFEGEATLRIVDHVMRANGRAVHALGAPALSDALRAVGQIRDFWSGSAVAALHELPFVVIYIGLIAYIGSWLALIPLALTPVAFLAALLVVRRSSGEVREAEAAEEHRRNLVWGIFGGIVEVKAMGAEAVLTRRYRRAVSHAMDAGARTENHMALIRRNGALPAQVSTIAVVTVGALMVVSGSLTTGGLAACTLLAGRSIGPAMGSFAYLSRIAYRKDAERKIDRVLSLPEAPLWRGDGGDSFRGGTMDIAGEAIQGGRVSIPQGSVVHVEASDGPTATAALEAVAQLDDALALSFTFDGKPCTAFDRQSIRQGIALVSGPRS